MITADENDLENAEPVKRKSECFVLLIETISQWDDSLRVGRTRLKRVLVLIEFLPGYDEEKSPRMLKWI